MTKYYLVKVVARKYEHSSIRGVIEALRGVKKVENISIGAKNDGVKNTLREILEILERP